MAYNYNFNPGAAGLPQQNVLIQPQNIQPQNIQPLFPQPQGNVYNINSSLEVANVPVGAGLSIALCLPENLMYIKTMQNGNPLFYPYKIFPFSEQKEEQKTAPQEDLVPTLAQDLKACNERITELEQTISKMKKKGDDWA